MTLTDLQVELRNIEDKLAILHNEIEKMKPKSEEEKRTDFRTIDKLATKNAIVNDVIVGMPEESRKAFFKSLSYILLSAETDIYARLLYLTRLSVGGGMNLKSEEIYKSGLEIEDIDDIVKDIEEYRYTFLVEAFILAGIKGIAKEKTLSIVADVAKLMGCDQEELRMIALVAKCKLTDDMDKILEMPVPTKNRWMHQFWNYIPYEWIVKNRKEVGVICTKKYKCNIKERVQAGSIVRTGDIICKYTQKQKLKKKSWLSAFVDETEVKVEENVIEAPCDGIVFFINDSRKSEVNGKLDEYVVAYIVSYFDYYNDFDKWFKAKGV